MRPVNLLPEQHRPKRASGRRGGVAYGAIGALAVVLLAVLAVVVTSNQVSSRKDELAKLERDTAAAQQQAGALTPVADFISIKQSREDSVRQLAGRRFDWERLVRELARVIPAGAYITDVAASADGEAVGGGGAPAPTPVPVAGAAPAAVEPMLAVSGCARDQRQVATLLVRLRKLGLANDAELEESKRAVDADGAAAASTGTAGSGTAQATCGGYEFKAKVSFDAAALSAPAPQADRVPASLGGGQ